jgi:hypothetical protein
MEVKMKSSPSGHAHIFMIVLSHGPAQLILSPSMKLHIQIHVSLEHGVIGPYQGEFMNLSQSMYGAPVRRMGLVPANQRKIGSHHATLILKKDTPTGIRTQIIVTRKSETNSNNLVTSIVFLLEAEDRQRVDDAERQSIRAEAEEGKLPKGEMGSKQWVEGDCRESLFHKS